MSQIIASTYEVIEKIGAGGGGNVFLANHIRLGKKVVLKADRRAITTRPELLRREVDVLKDLSHQYIPRVYDFFIEGETVYTVMDYVAGESLDKPLKRGEKFSQAQVIKWAKQLLTALNYLHSPTHGMPPRGFVHSDIKPANLMRTPDNNICLIDFNIALALGEENIVGCSAGYASPEHYGLDFSSKKDREEIEEQTLTAAEDDVTEPASEEVTASSRKKLITPDIRSDIYSTGATLYHLLSGQRPARNAKEVTPLSEKEYSPQIVKIISKAMAPNPDLRYQTAEEMLLDFLHLRENDSRVRRYKRRSITMEIILSVFFVTGAIFAFVGLKRMQTTESWLKFAEYAQNALEEGKPAQAVEYALTSLPDRTGILQPDYTAASQRILAKALGVYDLADGYKLLEEFELPSSPFYIEIAPDGKTAACIYAYEMAVIDTASARIIATLPVAESALSEAEYLDSATLVYAGREGISVYDIEKNTVLWTGKPATSVCISGDKKSMAAICREDNFATVYEVSDGKIKYTVDFGKKHQHVTVNDSFANPNDNLLALNNDGTLLGVSFEDGTLQIFNLLFPEDDIQIFDETSGYTHFEGGFYEEYFAFSATNATQSVFAVIDTVNVEQTGGFESESAFSVQTDEEGVYVQTDNLLVNIHPVTGEQIPLVTTSEQILHFARSDTHTLMIAENELLFFDKNANLICRTENKQRSDFVQISEGIALIGSRDSSSIWIMGYENYSDKELFTYDSSYIHDEARLSADGETIMLFRYNQFRLYSIDGRLICETSIPDAEQVYDQQFIREGEKSILEVTYNDGTIDAYSAENGTLLYELVGEKPDLSLYEEFYTDKLRIESPLHGAPAAYNRKTGKLVHVWEEDAYLTYVTQTGENMIVQYVTADGYYYGQLLNDKCEVLADLPYLSDVIGDKLIFDYPTGNLRSTHIYDIDELIDTARIKR